MKKTDVIIIGSGLAGTYIALHLPKELNIVILSTQESNSSLAQGGIAMCLTEDDTYESHIKDTLTAGWYENDMDAVTKLVMEAPQHIQYLNSFGVYFDHDDSNQLYATYEGGHTNPRVIHIDGDQTGRSMMSTLHSKLITEPNITLINNACLLDLCVNDNEATGIIYEHQHHIHQLNASNIVLATGGLCDLYEHTTNQKGSTGEGLAIAARAGAKYRDLRYIQFHPTAFKPTQENNYFLITEALRGIGAYLLDSKLQRFMIGIHPLTELAPRDIVSKAIHEVMNKNNLDSIYIDTRHLDTDYLEQRFPNIFKVLASSGYTMGQDLIPVSPVAHYTIGGITTDLDGCTSIKNLYACGEVASTGVHGANRLASNSLLECLVFGKAIATHISSHDPIVHSNPFIIKQPIAIMTPPIDILHDFEHYRVQVQKIMSSYVGISRTREGLEHAHALLKAISDQIIEHGDKTIECLKLQNMIFLSLLIIKDCLTHASKGCHQKEVSHKELKLC